MNRSGGLVIGVIGGSGGIGASRFAAVLAASAAGRGGRSLLVDLDPAGGGIDVLLGAELSPGPRWSGLRLAGGALDAQLLLTGLPTWGRVAVLACDQPELAAPGQATEVLRSARPAAPVVVDLPRHGGPVRAAALGCCDVVVVLAAGDLAAMTAARAVVAGLRPLGPGGPVMLIVRGGRAAAARAAALIGVAPAARLPAGWRRDARPLEAYALPRRMRQVALGLLAAWPNTAGWVPHLEAAGHRG